MTIHSASDLRNHLINFKSSESDHIVNDNYSLFRVFPFNRFIDIVHKNQLVFVNPSKWEDPYENILNGKIITDSVGQKFTCPSYANSYYAQCWFVPPEMDAMWRIYSQDKLGVLVESCTALLYKSIIKAFLHPVQQLFIGKIKYLDESEFKSRFEDPEFLQSVIQTTMYGRGGMEPYLFKRNAFSHEKEVRLLIKDCITREESDVLSVPFNPTENFPRVFLDPRLQKEDFERYRYILKTSGYDGEIHQSELYKIPELSLKINQLVSS